MKCTYCSGLCEPDLSLPASGHRGPVEHAPGMLLGHAFLHPLSSPAGPGSLVTTGTARTDSRWPHLTWTLVDATTGAGKRKRSVVVG